MRALGFDDVIFTLYRTQESHREVVAFAAEADLFAVTMHWKVALESRLARQLSKRGVFVYAHKVNRLDAFEELQSKGVSGIYTARLRPGDLRASASQ